MTKEKRTYLYTRKIDTGFECMVLSNEQVTLRWHVVVDCASCVGMKEVRRVAPSAPSKFYGHKRLQVQQAGHLIAYTTRDRDAQNRSTIPYKCMDALRAER